MCILLNSEADTQKLGYKIAEEMKGGEVVLLIGDLGAGKTTFSQGFARGLGISDTLGSPTFTLLNIHKGRLIMYHYDLFRVDSLPEIDQSGLSEYFGAKDGVCVIEWADKFLSVFDGLDTVRVTIQYIGENERKAIIERKKGFK